MRLLIKQLSFTISFGISNLNINLKVFSEISLFFFLDDKEKKL